MSGVFVLCVLFYHLFRSNGTSPISALHFGEPCTSLWSGVRMERGNSQRRNEKNEKNRKMDKWKERMEERNKERIERNLQMWRKAGQYSTTDSECSLLTTLNFSILDNPILEKSNWNNYPMSMMQARMSYVAVFYQ